MDLSLLHGDHAAIRRALHALYASTTDDIAAHADGLSRCLARLDALLDLHIAIERRYVCAPLLHAADPAARRIAGDAAAGLEQAHRIHRALLARYADAAAIRANPADFAADARAACDALLQTIAREDALLYPLARTFDACSATDSAAPADAANTPAARPPA